MIKSSGTPSAIKEVNRNEILSIVRDNPAITKPRIAREAGLSLTTVNKIVAELEAQEFVLACDLQPSAGGGRPARGYRLNEERQLVAVVYIICGVCHGRVSRLDGSTLLHESRAHAGGDWTGELCALIDDLMERTRRERVAAIGVAVPGTVSDGVLHNIPSIPQWEDLALERCLAERFGLPVLLENDIKIAAMGAYRDLGGGALRSMVYLYMQEGIGAGLVLDGALYRSRNGFAGELGFLVNDRGAQADRPHGVGGTERLLREALRTGNGSELRHLVAGVINNICCMLDPDLVAVDCHALGEEDLPAIVDELRRTLPDAYLPRIAVERADVDRYLEGLTALCIEQSQRSLRLVSQ